MIRLCFLLNSIQRKHRMLYVLFKERGLCNSGLKAKSTTFVRNITTIRLRSQFVILKMNINMTDNKNISVKKQLLVNKLLQDSQMGQKSFLTMLL